MAAYDRRRVHLALDFIDRLTGRAAGLGVSAGALYQALNTRESDDGNVPAGTFSLSALRRAAPGGLGLSEAEAARLGAEAKELRAMLRIKVGEYAHRNGLNE